MTNDMYHHNASWAEGRCWWVVVKASYSIAHQPKVINMVEKILRIVDAEYFNYAIVEFTDNPSDVEDSRTYIADDLEPSIPNDFEPWCATTKQCDERLKCYAKCPYKPLNNDK